MAQNNAVGIKKKNFKPIFVTVALVFALAGVIYAMRYARSWQFRQGLEVLFNIETETQAPPKIWTWCPNETGSIQFHEKSASDDSVAPEQICKVALEPVPEEKAKREMKRYLTVGTGETRKTLEADETLEVFRVDGLIFQSQELTRILKGH